MIEVTITVRTRVTEQHYNEHVKEAVDSIRSGKLQRELMEMEGVSKATATVQVIKPKKK